MENIQQCGWLKILTYKHDFAAERYTFSADVYSFAITMYELADRALPFMRSERDLAIQLGVKIALDVSYVCVREVRYIDACANSHFH